MFRNIILAGVVLGLVACGKAPGDRAITVHDGGGIKRVVVVKDMQWRIDGSSGTIYGAKRIYQDELGQPKYDEYAEPADQKAYDTVYEYLTGRPPLKAD